MVDFSITPRDLSPLWKLAEIKKQDEIEKRELARRDRIDQMNATTTRLTQERMRREMATLAQSEKGRVFQETFISANVGVMGSLEPIFEALAGGLEVDSAAKINAISKIEGAKQAFKGTPWEAAFSQLGELARTDQWEAVYREGKTGLEQAQLMKPFLEQYQASQDFDNAIRGQEEAEDLSTKEIEIQALSEILMRSDPNITQQQALDLATQTAYGHRDVEMSQSGQLGMTNDLLGTGNLITPPADTSTPAPIPPRETMWDMASRGTGAGSALKELWANTAGQIFPGAVDDETVQARQGLRSQQTGIIRAFALNSRYTGPQIDLVTEEVKIRPEVFDSPESMRNRMISIDENMGRREQQLVDFLNDTNVPENQKSEDRTLLREIRNFRTQLGVPITSPAQLTIETIDSMSDEELQQSVRAMGQSITELPEEVKAELIRRRSN